MGYKALKRTRKFLGKTEGFENKQERNFEKAHLKAYLAGRFYFYHGFQDSLNGRTRILHEVKQEFPTRQ